MCIQVFFARQREMVVSMNISIQALKARGRRLKKLEGKGQDVFEADPWYKSISMPGFSIPRLDESRRCQDYG